MRLRNLFHREPATATPMAAAPESAAPQDEPMSAEYLEELRAAWAELAEASKASTVPNFHACTRTGRPWTKDPAALRAIAATLRDHL